MPTVVSHFQSLNNKREHNHNLHMFAEDVYLSVMPIGGKSSSQSQFSVSLNGSPAECERALQIIKSLARYDRYDPTGSVCDAVEEIAKHLSWEGCAVYEIISNGDDVPYLYSFTPKNLIKLFNRFVQIIPRIEWKVWGKKWVFIPCNKIWYIEMPKILGGQKGYVSILRKLKRIDSISPKFWQLDMELGEQSKDFDFKNYRLNIDIYMSKITKTWGWNRRDLTQERSTEFFSIFKLVTFHWAQAVLREHIIGELNTLLSRLGINCKIIVSGLPSVLEIEETKQQLISGTLTFAAATDKVSIF